MLNINTSAGLNNKSFYLNSQVFYFLKWENYGNDQNTWEPENHLDGCEELIQEFDISMGHKLSGIKKIGNEMVYLLEYKDIYSISAFTQDIFRGEC